MEGHDSTSSPVTTIGDVLAKSPDTPLTPQEMNLTISLVRRQLSKDSNCKLVLIYIMSDYLYLPSCFCL